MKKYILNNLNSLPRDYTPKEISVAIPFQNSFEDNFSFFYSTEFLEFPIEEITKYLNIMHYGPGINNHTVACNYIKLFDNQQTIENLPGKDKIMKALNHIEFWKYKSELSKKYILLAHCISSNSIIDKQYSPELIEYMSNIRKVTKTYDFYINIILSIHFITFELHNDYKAVLLFTQIIVDNQSATVSFLQQFINLNYQNSFIKIALEVDTLSSILCGIPFDIVFQYKYNNSDEFLMAMNTVLPTTDTQYIEPFIDQFVNNLASKSYSNEILYIETIKKLISKLKSSKLEKNRSLLLEILNSFDY